METSRITSEFEQGARDLHVLHGSVIAENLEKIAPLYAKLNTAAFALEEPTRIDEAVERLSSVDLLLLASDNRDNLIGFATYQCIPSSLGKVIYQARGLMPEARGLGFGRKFPRIAAYELQADFLMAKAQNPISIWSTIASELFEEVFPIDGDFSCSSEMSQVLLDTVTCRGKRKEVDMRTGVHKNSYTMGKLGDYIPDISHSGVSAIQERLTELGIDALNGDAIYYGGKIA
ncbi:hypothetical protein [Streptomyces sp. NPDC006996]|uniref:hypothetical protein n=1 Tax=Streptomyces sp. NPDC006996 TaxID=3156908 RepID=UPI0033C679AC